jgi:alpha-ketoglutarate-dependent taurine dioxygenase
MKTSPKPLPKPGAIARKAVNLSGADDLVRTADLVPGREIPVKIEPALEGVRLARWAESHCDRIEGLLRRRGAVLFRGFGPLALEEFQEVVRRTSGELLTYTYRSTPRREVSGRIYTSTEYPAHQWIPMHNEMSYTRRWPLRIGFFCAQPSARGGETPIADSRRVYQRLDPALRERFEAQGVLYVRNYGSGLDVSWQEVFQTDDRAEAEEFCRQNGIEAEWRAGDRLRTRQVCQATARHPGTGEPVWFNQAHLFHVSSLEPAVREALQAQLDPADLPRNTYYGDGSPIEDGTLEEIREVFRQEMVLFPWQTDDILLLDNVLVAHGRAPFEGARRVLVAMAQPAWQESTEVSR